MQDVQQVNSPTEMIKHNDLCSRHCLKRSGQVPSSPHPRTTYPVRAIPHSVICIYIYIYIYIYGNCDLIPFGIIDPTPGGNRGAKDFGKNASNQVGAEASPQPKGCREAAPQAERVCGGARKPKCRVVHLKLLRLVRMCENWCFFILLDRRPAAGIVHSSKNVCFASRKHDFPS